MRACISCACLRRLPMPGILAMLSSLPTSLTNVLPYKRTSCVISAHGPNRAAEYTQRFFDHLAPVIARRPRNSKISAGEFRLIRCRCDDLHGDVLGKE